MKPISVKFLSAVMLVVFIMAMAPSLAFATTNVSGSIKTARAEGGRNVQYQTTGKYNQLGNYFADLNSYFRVKNTTKKMPKQTMKSQAAVVTYDALAKRHVHWGTAKWNMSAAPVGTNLRSEAYYQMTAPDGGCAMGRGYAIGTDGSVTNFTSAELFLISLGDWGVYSLPLMSDDYFVGVDGNTWGTYRLDENKGVVFADMVRVENEAKVSGYISLKDMDFASSNYAKDSADLSRALEDLQSKKVDAIRNAALNCANLSLEPACVRAILDVLDAEGMDMACSFMEKSIDSCSWDEAGQILEKASEIVSVQLPMKSEDGKLIGFYRLVRL